LPLKSHQLILFRTDNGSIAASNLLIALEPLSMVRFKEEEVEQEE